MTEQNHRNLGRLSDHYGYVATRHGFEGYRQHILAELDRMEQPQVPGRNPDEVSKEEIGKFLEEVEQRIVRLGLKDDDLSKCGDFSLAIATIDGRQRLIACFIDQVFGRERGPELVMYPIIDLPMEDQMEVLQQLPRFIANTAATIRGETLPAMQSFDAESTPF